MKQSLNFSWNFIPSYSDDYLSKLPSEAVKVNIPHTVKEVPYNYFSEQTYQFVSTYEKVFDVSFICIVPELVCQFCFSANLRTYSRRVDEQDMEGV